MAVLAFGSINLDLTARVPALPGPGETALGRRLETAAGGKGANQALAARRAGGGVVRLVGRVGRDPFADRALELLAAAGVDLSRVERADEATGVALIAVSDSGENQIAVAAGANAGLTDAAVPEDWLAADTVLSLTLEAPLAAVAALARRASGRGARIVLNASPAMAAPAGLLDRLGALIVNEHEAPVVARAAGFDAETAVGAGRALAARRGLAVIVTLGAAGAVAFRGGKAWTAPALKLDRVVDSTGAGDAFAGAFAAALDRGLELAPALARAAVAGSLACTRAGAQPAMPTAAEIDAALPRLGPVQRANFEID